MDSSLLKSIKSRIVYSDDVECLKRHYDKLAEEFQIWHILLCAIKNNAKNVVRWIFKKTNDEAFRLYGFSQEVCKTCDIELFPDVVRYITKNSISPKDAALLLAKECLDLEETDKISVLADNCGITMKDIFSLYS